jgi:selenobiotic family peptide radical SAM maturase
MIRDGWLRGRTTRGFTLQWHLTNVCPYECRHCYDRAQRCELDLPQALGVLQDLREFCRRRRVTPHVSLSGGDPLCYSHFWELYAAIAAAGVRASILGNPITPELIGRLLEISPPIYYQVSLEGLREHNDAVRGDGHFDRVMTFLADARRLGLSTHVMLTLTRANVDEVIPLGELLRGLTERFTFNRLSQVGNAVELELPERRRFVRFLRQYLAARRLNPLLGLKENLFAILCRRGWRRPFGGCTGFGCGAAFNFVALLPDGEVHACRKYPSLLGNVRSASLDAIYDSPLARQYRAGPAACRGCRHERHCRGCPAVVFGQGLDPLHDRDPYCFLGEKKAGEDVRRDVEAAGDAFKIGRPAGGKAETARDINRRD